LNSKAHHTPIALRGIDDHLPALYMVMTERGPFLVLVLGGDTAETILRNEMRRRGHPKFFAWPLPPDDIRNAYGASFEIIEDGLCRELPLRVLDFDGTRVFENTSFAHLGHPVFCEG